MINNSTLKPKRGTARRKQHPVAMPGAMKSNRVKPGVLRDKAYLDRIRAQEFICAISGKRGTDTDPVVPMHIGVLGTGIKAPDNEVLPVLNSLHMLSHSQRGVMSAPEFWLKALENDHRLLIDMVKAYARQFYQTAKEQKDKR